MSIDKLPEGDQLALRRLVQNVARCFYDARFIVVLDQLVRHPVLKDDDLAGRLGLQLKELGKLTATLCNHRLVSKYQQNEQKEGGFRAVARSYYYIDYKSFCNVVKWRISQMRRDIDKKLRNELDNKGYICPRCSHCYTPLEADQLLDFATQTLRCLICQHEVVDNESAAGVVGSHDRMQRFNAQMAAIREGLKQSESVVIPAFDVAVWIRQNLLSDKKPDGSKASADGKVKPEGLDIVLDADKDEESIRREREAEAAAKRQQNAMPSWHLKSTVSGDLTALGVQNSRAEQAAAPVTSLPNSNASILRSLSTLGPIPVVSQQPTESIVITEVEETKPVVDQQADYYDQYYASLQNASNSTPMASDEDEKPSLSYLNGLVAGAKRAREHLELQDDRSAKTHRPSLLGPGRNVVSRHSSRTESSEGSPPPATMPASLRSSPPTTQDESMDDDPDVMVAGKPVPFSQITEEHHDLMTPDEYTAYFELIDARGM
ncbi:hypothetical protein AURDEDRAFT_116120 [Auricularia subglabra TFB-10046 SS5]|uniref:HTH TFE/IIEalpha-type domain-containing protein n=1 Tax=Auricularia subglabra (strain TFB-10046 / SS5) TaxID=717982 RepID=J0WXG4_AURST|nr:hypothetical protein AURDEDRAFT_116120 [Auricularia subglabra TFB-10046 SS5]